MLGIESIAPAAPAASPNLNTGASRMRYCGAWSWRLNFLHDFSLTILVEKGRGHWTYRPGL